MVDTLRADIVGPVEAQYSKPDVRVRLALPIFC
jgi:hypothetical protein